MKYKKKKDRKNIILITVAALALVVTTAVWLLCFTGDNQGYRTISVVDLSGNVSVVKDDIEYSAYPGMVLQEGHEIVTAANSYVRLVLDDDKYVKLEPGSKMVFDTLGVFGSNKTKLNLERGSMTSEIVKPLDSDAEYVVVAPNAVLSVRGTFFRVDLGVGEDGQINADVMTYGGSVASQRVMPTGEVMEEEVLIDAGFKTSINMGTEDTVYVMQAVDGAIDTTGDGVANLAPIVKTDIPDDDMVDIYFASENGHELFVTAEEVKEDIEERGINLEEQTSVYEKAEVILAEQQKETNQQLSMTDVSVFADDNVPLARVEEVVKEQESISEETSTSEKTSEAVSETASANNVPQGMLTDGVGEETIIEHVHTSVMGGTEGAHRECSECGEVLSTVHSFSKKETVAATCETAGENTFTCLCGYSYTEEIEATGHTAVSGGTASAHTQCSVCNEILGAEHSYAEEVTVAAGCTEDGEKKYTCSCGYSYTESIAATGHNGVASTSCKTVCSHCDKTLSTNHSYTSTITTAATCENTGVKTYACACGSSYTEEIAATGHSYGEWVTTTAATCEAAGSKSRTCSGCGNVETEEIVALGHDYATEFTVDTAVTCTTAGTQSKHCSRCDATTEVTEIEATGHSYGDWSTTTAATCEAAGSKSRTCGVCGDVETETIVAQGHDYATEFTVDTEATCTTAGSQSKHCSRCDATTEVTEIEATGHTEVTGGTADCHSKCQVCKATIKDGTSHTYESEITTEATCTATGIETYTCACGYSYTKEIPLADHTEVTGGTADCHSKCEICGTTIEDENGHSYTESITTAATCTTAGLATYTCSCGYEYTEEIEALGHEGTGSGNTTCEHCGEAMLALNATNFPDAAFLAYVKTNFNTVTTDDEILLGEEVNALTACTEVDISDGAYTDLTGIEYFTALTTLNCSNNSGLTGIPTSTLTNLTTLNITNCTSISSIDLSACSNLTSLTAEGCTSLKTIDASGCPELTFLDADGSGVEIVNVNGCTKITTLSNLQLYSTNSLVELYAQGVPAISGSDLSFEGRSTLEVIDFSGCTDMTTLNLSNCPALKTVNLSGCTNLATLNLTDSTAITDLNISGTKLTGLDVSGCADLATLTPATGLTSLDISGCTSLTTLDTTSLTALITLVADNSGLTSLDVTACANITSISVADCTVLAEINASGCTSLTELVLASATNLTSLDVSNCTALTNLDISTLVNLEVFQACSAGITMLSNDSTCLNFSYNPKLKEIYVNDLTSFTEINLTANTELEKFIYDLMPMTTIDLSNCVSLQNFQTGGSNVTSLDFSNCPDIFRIINHSSSALTAINVSGCTKLCDLSLLRSNNVSSVDITNAGTEVEVGAYVADKYLVFTTTAGSTTETTLQEAEGWNDSIMYMSNERL